MEVIEFCRLRDPYGEFSNFYPSKITLDGLDYKTVEHFYQSQKFIDLSIREHIRNQDTPMKAKNAAYNPEFKSKLRRNWDTEKLLVMGRALKKKFEIESFKNLLLSTGNAEIVERSEKDYYWGKDKSGFGFNMLGKLLMELREEIRIRENKNKFF